MSAATSKIWADKNRERVNAAARARYHAPKTREAALKYNAYKQRTQRRRLAAASVSPREWLRLCLFGIKHRAKRKGVVFAISADDIETPTLCPITGLALQYGRGRGRAKKDTPSVDRINPKRGYEKGNVRILSHYANAIKRDCCDPAIFRALADDAERQQCKIS